MNTTQVTLSIPDAVYQQAQTMAEATNRQVAEVLSEALSTVFAPIYVHPQRVSMQQETHIFEQRHAELWQKYPKQYVAIYQGELVDHDPDEIELLGRITAQYPDVPVLIRQVLPSLPDVLHIRSPRFVNAL